jgi:hypothetical protein
MGAMAETEDEIRKELLWIAGELMATRDRLRLLRLKLPASPREDLIHLNEAEMDFPTLVGSCLDCVLADRMSPAIEFLQETARWPAGEENDAIRPN